MACRKGRRPAGKDSDSRCPQDLCTRAQQLCTIVSARFLAAFAGSARDLATATHPPLRPCAMVAPGPPANRSVAHGAPFSIVADQLPEESTPPAVNPDLAHIWHAIQSELKRPVPQHPYDLWLAPLRPVSMDGQTIVVQAPEGTRARVAERFGRVLQSCAGAVLGPQATVDVVAPGSVPRETPAADAQPSPVAEGDGVNRKLTFESFVIGDTNR